jgi:hypothetical protein
VQWTPDFLGHEHARTTWNCYPSLRVANTN